MKKILLTILAATLLWSTIQMGFAAIQLNPDLMPDELPNFNITSVDSANGIDGETAATQSLILFVGNLVSQVLLFTGAIAIISLIIAGANYIFAFGKDERIEKGKRGIFWSLVGLMIILLSYSITRGIISFIIQIDSAATPS